MEEHKYVHVWDNLLAKRTMFIQEACQLQKAPVTETKSLDPN